MNHGREQAAARERPFVMSGDDVRAVMAGLKTQARRVMDPQPPSRGDNGQPLLRVVPSLLANRGDLFDAQYDLDNPHARRCPYGAPGERLWVREAWGRVAGAPVYRVLWTFDYPPDGGHWHRAAAMPRTVARLVLNITALHAERLQDIAVADIIAEGITVPPVDYSVAERPDVLDYERSCFAREAFSRRWDRDFGKRAGGAFAWAQNPWVWVPEFTVERAK